MRYRAELGKMFDAAVMAALPRQTLAGRLPARPKGKTIVIGAGKGTAQLAQEFEKQWGAPVQGLVVTRYGYGAETQHIEICEAAHPVPDQAGFEATQRIISMLSNLTEDDLVIALITGGGSALLPAPLDGLTLSDEQTLCKALLASGAPISAMNTIRKHFSAVKGGRLAKLAYPAKVHTIIVSDIPGDTPSEVASGPTLASPGRIADSIALIEQYKIDLPEKLRGFLARQSEETPRLDDPQLAFNSHDLVACNNQSLVAAGDVAKLNGWRPTILSDRIEGEARHIGGMHADIARRIRTNNAPFPRGTALLSGGEATVSLSDTSGKGGPNTEFLLSFAIRIDGLEGIEAIAADTDGIDGSKTNAGAFADGTTCSRLRTTGLCPMTLLARNDSYSAFEALGDLFSPGPSGTNVNDFRAILVS